MKVYGLKRATPKMKYQHMKFMMDWKADLKEKQAAEYQRRIEEKLGDLMCQLREVDPAWETWFDDDHNVPNVSHARMIPYIERRVAELTPHQSAEKHLELRREPFIGIPACDDTLPSLLQVAADTFTAATQREGDIKKAAPRMLEHLEREGGTGKDLSPL